MNFEKEFYNVLSQTNEIALATSVNGIPHVRIVNFCLAENRPGVLYFASDRNNQKVAEFAQNNKVAYTSIPARGQIAHVRSHAAGVQKSQLTLAQVQHLFIAAIPGYDETIQAIGETLDVFEVYTGDALVVESYENAGRVTFQKKRHTKPQPIKIGNIGEILLFAGM